MATIKKFRIKNFKIKKPLVELKNVSLFFESRQILDKININLNSGEIVGLLGPNGAGKSSIFNLIIGLIYPNKGNIIIQNEIVNFLPIYERARKFKIGYVPQYGGYFHELTLIENLKAIGEICIKDTSERENKINRLILKFGLDNVQEIKAKFLSGGQKRKLVISMALMNDPNILLCDEIFAALDILTIKTLKELIVNLQKENSKMCIIICEHQARDLLEIVDRAMILSNCQIIAEGSPNNILNNENAKSQYFGNF